VDTRYPAVLDFIDHLDEIRTVDDVWTALLTFTDRYGFKYGGLADIPSADEDLEDTTLCVSWPAEWRDRYFHENYIQRDPAVLHMSKTSDPYTWIDTLDDPDYTRVQRRIVHEAGEFGMTNGLIVPILGLSSGKAIVSIAGDNTDLSVREKAEIHLAAIYAHGRIRTLAHPKRRQIIFPALSRRERQCLQWVAVGKSDWEIGEILSISEKTANYHVEQIKRKYNVATRVQAVVHGIRSGAIQP
jgi:LuxR family transcriptional regulator, quorum-sensing system regulator BjaR1